MDHYFCLFACCIPVRGFRRSTLCDLQRDAYMLIPNQLYDILVKHKRKPVGQVQALYPGVDVGRYFDVLVEQEYGYYSADPTAVQRNSPLGLDYEEAQPITNAIIDFDACSNHPCDAIFAQLSFLRCEAVELRFFCQETVSGLRRVLDYATDSTFRSIEVLVAYDPGSHSQEAIGRLFKDFPQLKKLTLHSHARNTIEEIFPGCALICVQTVIDSEAHCGVVSPYLFQSTLKQFSEAKKYNTCLNKKISVDKRGNVKNCPSSSIIYGNVRNISLTEVLKTNNSFTALWNISKDQVSVCRDCEFRYMCQDCRVMLSNPADRYSKPSKCSYNPYEAVWEQPDIAVGSRVPVNGV